MNPTNTYFEQQVMAAEPRALVHMLYRKAISLVQSARQFLASGQIVERSQAILKAYDILLELTASLRDEVAPELCANLRRLYLYMQQLLMDGNIQQRDEPLAEVLNLLNTMAEAWAPQHVSASEFRERARPVDPVSVKANAVAKAYGSGVMAYA